MVFVVVVTVVVVFVKRVVVVVFVFFVFVVVVVFVVREVVVVFVVVGGVLVVSGGFVDVTAAVDAVVEVKSYILSRQGHIEDRMFTNTCLFYMDERTQMKSR